MSKKEVKNKGGRPRKEIDQKTFEGLCGLQCTQEEMCGFFDIDEETLNSWCKRTYLKGFSEVFKAKRGVGKISLRRIQWRQAEKSPAMAIFLGKQFLDQSDNYRLSNTEEKNENLVNLANIINNPQKQHKIEIKVNPDTELDTENE